MGTKVFDKGMMTYQHDYGKEYTIPIYCWYIEGGDKKILVDTGELKPIQSQAREQAIGGRIYTFEEGLARYGLTTADVVRAAGAATAGVEAGEVAIGDERVPLVVLWGTAGREVSETLRRATVAAPGGGAPIPLTSVADLELAATPVAIHRVNGMRTAFVEAWLTGDARKTRQAATEALAPLELPAGVSFEIVESP